MYSIALLFTLEELRALNLSKGANVNGGVQVKGEAHRSHNGVVTHNNNNFHYDEEYDDLNEEETYDDEDDENLGNQFYMFTLT